VSGKGLVPRYSWFLLSVLSLVLLLAACHAPAPTPTPTSTPTPALPAPVTVDLSGEMDATGATTGAVTIVSSDGRVELTLPKGAQVWDAQRQLTTSITCTPYQPPESKEGMVVGLAYGFGGATVMPAAIVSISYDPPPPHPGIDLSKPEVAFWWPPSTEWITWPNARQFVNLATHTVTIRQIGFYPMVVMFWYADMTPPVS
jgi:hypothetical protein